LQIILVSSDCSQLVKDIAEDTGAYAIVVKEIKLHVAEFPEVKFIHERCLTRFYPAMPMFKCFRFMERVWDPANSTTAKQGKGTRKFTQVHPPRG
jgi:hypothetical protein